MMKGAIITLTLGLLALPAPGATLYQTDFSTGDVNPADWSLTGTIAIDLDSGLNCNGGWGSAKYGTLTGSATISAADVSIVADCAGIGTGNGNSLAEVAGRTSTGTDGVYIRVYGAWESAKLELYDGATLIDFITSSTIDSQNYAFTVTLEVSGTSATATIYQPSDYHGDPQTEVLSGTITTTTSAGNVRFGGVAYTEGPLYTAVQISEIPEPTTVGLMALGAAALLRRRTAR